jgi:hypothetical protein
LREFDEAEKKAADKAKKAWMRSLMTLFYPNQPHT